MSREPSDADSRVALSAGRPAETPPLGGHRGRGSASAPEASGADSPRGSQRPERGAWGVQQYVKPAHRDALLCSCSLQVGGRLLVFTASADGELRAWGCSPAAPTLQLAGCFPLPCGACALAASGPSLFAGLGSGQVLHLDLRPLLAEEKAPARPGSPLFCADSPVRFLAVSGQTLVAQAQSSRVYVYDLRARGLATSLDLATVSAGAPNASLLGVSGYYPHEAASASLQDADTLLSALSRGAVALTDLRRGRVVRKMPVPRPPTRILGLGPLGLEGSFLTGHTDESLARWDARMTGKPLDTSSAGAVPLCMRPISDVWTRRCEPDWPAEGGTAIYLSEGSEPDIPPVGEESMTDVSVSTATTFQTQGGAHRRVPSDPESSTAQSHHSATLQPEPRRRDGEAERPRGRHSKHVAVGLSNGVTKIYDVTVMGHSRASCRAEGDMGVSQEGGITCVEWLTRRGLLTGGQDCGLFVYQ